jgi:hypothetical protein
MSDTFFGRETGASSAAESAGFWTLFVTQTAALLVVGAFAIPVYRLLFVGPGAGVPGAVSLPLFLAATLMQVCYWSRRRYLPLPRVRRDDLSGHILLFLARALFVCAAAFVPLAVIRFGEVTPSPLGVVAAPLALFAVFCYAWELERLARTRLDADDDADADAD